MNKTITMGILAIVLMASIVSAAININWLNPSFNNETLDTYPQEIRIYANASSVINHCNITIEGKKNYVFLNATAAEINVQTRLGDGGYTATINCTDASTNTQQSLEFKVDEGLINAKIESNKNKIWLWAIIIAGCVLLYSRAKGKIEKTATSGLILLASVTILDITTFGMIAGIPIVISIAMVLYHAFEG